MKTLLTLFISTLLTLTVFGQSNIVDEIKPLITKEKIDQAEKKVDEFLKKNPNSVDALMMKGNVIYYKYSFKQPEISLNGNPDESIFETSMGFMSEPILILPIEIANQVTTPWLKAVSIEKKRGDIHMGICHIYSISLQTDKLINYLPILKQNIELNDNSPYDFANYARNLKDRDNFDDAIKVYQNIYELFPQTSGLLGDMAAEFFLKGNLLKAKEYADAAMSKNDVDATTCATAFSIYAIMEEYTSATKAIQMESNLLKNKDNLFYQGLLELTQDKQSWKVTMKHFLESQPKDTAARNLSSFLLSNDFDNSKSAYTKAISFDILNGYKILIHKYYKTHSKEFLPSFKYAVSLTYNCRFDDAIKSFIEISKDNLSENDIQDIYFYSAYAYYKSRQINSSNENWEKLLKSDYFLYKSAAAYFLGKYYLDKKNKDKANEYFSLVADKANQSKYAMYCSNMLKR